MTNRLALMVQPAAKLAIQTAKPAANFLNQLIK